MSEPDGCAFDRLYGPVAAAPSLVLGQLGQSLDGRIATETGHSHYVNGREALVHLHRLRAGSTVPARPRDRVEALVGHVS